jgi:hypothetical protein
MVYKWWYLWLRKFFFHFQKFLQISIFTKLCNYVAVVETIENIKAMNYIFMIELFQYVNFLLQKGKSDFRCDGLNFDDFNSYWWIISDIKSPEHLTEATWAELPLVRKYVIFNLLIAFLRVSLLSFFVLINHFIKKINTTIYIKSKHSPFQY